MKKMLVLALVLAVAGLANAGLVSLQANLQTVTMVGSGFTATDDPFTNFVVFTVGTAVPVLNFTGTGSAITDMAPVYGLAAFEGMLNLEAGSVKAAFMVEIKDTTPDVLALPNGVLMTTTTTGAGKAYLLDQGGAQVGQPISIVPEPMTMVLLGLGGLFLRKK